MIPHQSRLLFLVETLAGDRVGHCGLALSDKTATLKNMIGGCDGSPPNLFLRAGVRLMLLEFDEFLISNIRAYLLTTLVSMITIHRRIGIRVQRTDFLKSIKYAPGEVRWDVCSEEESNVSQRLVELSIAREQFFARHAPSD